MFKRHTISLVFPAYNEEENIGRAIKDFKSLKIFDEIIVVNNNSKDKTVAVAKKSSAKVVTETRQGYGFALRRGMLEAKGEYIMLSEPDSTFAAKDCLKILKEMSKYDLVTGTRTNTKYIQKGANMKFFLRSGNFALAKLTQLLYHTNPLTDCGCTYRVFNKKVIKKIGPHLTVGGSHFLPETIVLSTLFGFKIKEIPIHYRKRVGKSKITGSFKKSVLVGLNMFKIILKYRFAPKSSIH